MRKIALALLSGYKTASRFAMRVRGVTPESIAEQKVASGQSWDEFCDTLKAAGANVLGHSTPRDALSQAEGYRYLSRITRAGLENFVECADTEAPRFNSIVDGFRVAPIKLGSDNPDNLYQNAAIDGRRTYRIWGTRGTVNYLGFGTQAGAYGQPGGLRTFAYVEASELRFEQDGSFEIFAGPEEAQAAAPKHANWIKTDPSVPEGAGMVIVRQTFEDRTTETPATVSIEVAGSETAVGATKVPPPFTCEKLDKGLQNAGLLVAGASFMCVRACRLVLPSPVPSSPFGLLSTPPVSPARSPAMHSAHADTQTRRQTHTQTHTHTDTRTHASTLSHTPRTPRHALAALAHAHCLVNTFVAAAAPLLAVLTTPTIAAVRDGRRSP